MPPTPQARGVPVVAVGAVVLDSSERVLLVRRARPPAAGSWTLPGGHVEPRESLEAAVVREVREETAIATRVVCMLEVAALSVDGFAYSIHEHLLVPIAEDPPQPIAGDDAADVRWVARSELESLGVRAEVTRIIERAIRELRSSDAR